MLGLKESGYYQWIRRLKRRQEKEVEKRRLAEQVGGIFRENHCVYGYRKMQRAMAAEGVEMSIYRVRKVMQENGYYPAVLKKYRPGRNGARDGRYFENILRQNFRIPLPNMVWSGDITYIKTKLGFVYLATVIDLYNREIIGYSISKQMDSDLTCSALGNAIMRTGNKSQGVVFHSDRGCQYSSRAYQQMLRQHGIKGSMSCPACPYDNACAESFFSSAKRECILRKGYASIEEVRQDMFAYIELFYNRKRMHASLGYLSPVQYRLKHAIA